MDWRFKACGACTGDLTLEDGAWRCWQCGRYDYGAPPGLEHLLHGEREGLQVQGTLRLKARMSYGGLAGGNINVVIRGRELRRRGGGTETGTSSPTWNKAAPSVRSRR